MPRLGHLARGLACLSLLLVPALAAGQEGAAGWGASVATPRVTSRLVAERASAAPGKTVRVALDQTVIPHWHTYWKNPGDSGLPIKLKWTLPAGWTAGPIQWPSPERFEIGGLMNYGYEGQVRLLTTLTAPANATAGDAVNATAEATWLVCKDICIPERVVLPLTLTVGPAGVADAAAAKLFREADAAMPRAGAVKVAFVTGAAGNRLDVAMTKAQAAKALGSYFFAEDQAVLAAAAKQTVTADDAGLHIALPSPGPLPSGPVRGVLRISDKGGAGLQRVVLVNATPGPAAAADAAVDPAVAQPATAVDAAAPAAVAGPVETAPKAAQAAATAAPAQGAKLGLLQAALFALLGGVILNLMPCVFPILSMKALALTQHGPGHARAHGLAYAAGVMICFVAIAGLLIALRAGGATIGWGFQLQSPVVVAALALIMFLLGLSMSGVFTVGSGVVGVGSGLASQSGLTGSFFTGVLATVVATPCTAPFMGAAVGYALVQPWPFALTVFLALGFGMALPFVLLTFFDPLLKRLPRPGVWMDRVKHVLAFPLYASAVWLVWVLAIQSGPDAVAAVLAGMVVLAFAAWLYGLNLEDHWRRISQGVVIAALAATVLLLRGPISTPAPKAGAPAVVAEGAAGAYSEASLTQLRDSGRPVLVNMTAAWCITCLANERTSLSRASVKDAMSRKNVAYLKGDWTNQDAAITAVLQKHGRDGVPLYLMYVPGRAEPQVLPQILTETIVLNALNAAPDRS